MAIIGEMQTYGRLQEFCCYRGRDKTKQNEKNAWTAFLWAEMWNLFENLASFIWNISAFLNQFHSGNCFSKPGMFEKHQWLMNELRRTSGTGLKQFSFQITGSNFFITALNGCLAVLKHSRVFLFSRTGRCGKSLFLLRCSGWWGQSCGCPGCFHGYPPSQKHTPVALQADIP